MKDDEPKHFMSNRLFWALVVFCITLPFLVFIFPYWRMLWRWALGV